MTASSGAVETWTGVTVTPGEVEISLVARPSAVPAARHFTAGVLLGWRLGHLVEVAELLSSELVTNAVKATGAAVASDNHRLVRLRLTMSGNRLFVIVWDDDKRPPVLKDVAHDTESGRGLILVETLSERWGHRPSRRGGKIVWCELIATPEDSAETLPNRIPSPTPPGDIDIPTVDSATLRRFIEGLKALV